MTKLASIVIKIVSVPIGTSGTAMTVVAFIATKSSVLASSFPSSEKKYAFTL